MSIELYDSDNNLLEVFEDAQDMYNELTRRYIQLVQKRQRDLLKEWWKGFRHGVTLTLLVIAVTIIIISFL